MEPGDANLVSETLVFIGPDSVPVARAAFAAGQQDRYWQYAALLFANQGVENSGYVTDEFLTNLAHETEGLNVNGWNEARRGGFEKELRAAQQSAKEADVNSTPSVLRRPGARLIHSWVPGEPRCARS